MMNRISNQATIGVYVREAFPLTCAASVSITSSAGTTATPVFTWKQVVNRGWVEGTRHLFTPAAAIAAYRAAAVLRAGGLSLGQKPDVSVRFSIHYWRKGKRVARITPVAKAGG